MKILCNKNNKHSPTSKHGGHLTHIQTLEDLEVCPNYALFFSRYIFSFHNVPLQVVNKIVKLLPMPLKILICNVPSSHYKNIQIPLKFFIDNVPNNINKYRSLTSNL